MRSFVTPSVLVLLVGGGACTQLLGDDFEVTPASTSTGPTTNGSGSGADVGGSGGDGGNGGNGGSASSAGGAGTRDDGQACAAPAECKSGFCADGICCDTACDVACARCDAAGSAGICTPHTPATDPEDGCEGVCDGAGTCADGTIRWGLEMGDDSTELNLRGGVSADGDDNVAIFGDFYGGTVDFGTGGTPPVANSSEDAYLFVAEANGDPKWVRVLGSPVTGSAVSPEAVELDIAGGVIITGGFRGEMRFHYSQGDKLTSLGDYDVFVARLSPTGSTLWRRSFGSNGPNRATDFDYAHAVSSDDAGNVLVAGTIRGPVDFGGGVRDPGADADLFVLKLDGNGAHQWSNVFTGLEPRAIDCDAAGRVGIGGSVRAGSPSLGGASLAGSHFVGMFDAGGSHVWSKAFTVASLGGVAVDRGGNLFATGSFTNAVNFGAGALVSDGDDHFLVKYRPDGELDWSLLIGADGGAPEGIGVDAAGNVTVGSNCSTLNVASVNLTVPGGSSGACALKVAGDGTPLWAYSTLAGNPDTQGLAVSTSGTVFLAGRMFDGIDFGFGLVTVTYEGAFVAAIAP